MEYEKFTEFKEKKDECNRKLKEAVELDVANEALEIIIASKALDEVTERNINATFEQKAGRMPLVGAQGSKHNIAFAISQIMEFDNDFYGILKLVCAYKRLQEIGAFKVFSAGKIDCEGREQRDLIRELMNKSPEELEKIKKDLKK